MENNTVVETKDLALENALLKVFLIVAVVTIPVIGIEMYKIGFMQGGIEVVKFAQKAAETAV